MAPAAAMCRRSVLRTQSQKMGSSGKRSSSCLSLETWARQTGTAAPTSSSPSSSSSGSSCTTEKGSKSSSAGPEEQEACSLQELARCETPKSKKHRIPVVNVDLCPPAPKKPRASGRSARAANLMPKFGFSPGYLF